MPRCPHCRSELDTLYYHQTITEYGHVSSSRAYGLEWDVDDSDSHGDIVISCPDCERTINMDPDDFFNQPEEPDENEEDAEDNTMVQHVRL